MSFVILDSTVEGESRAQYTQSSDSGNSYMAGCLPSKVWDWWLSTMAPEGPCTRPVLSHPQVPAATSTGWPLRTFVMQTLCRLSCCGASRLVQKQVWCQSSLVSKQVEGRIGKQPALFWASSLTHGAWTGHTVPHQWLALRVSFGLQFDCPRLCGRMLGAGIWLAGGNCHDGVNPSVGFMLDSCFAVEAPPLTCYFQRLVIVRAARMCSSSQMKHGFLFFLFKFSEE